MKLLVLMFLLCSLALADTCTVFETQFESLPDGWLSEEWQFNTNSGAWINETIYGYQSPTSCTATMSSLSDPEVWYFVPDGTDSLLVHIEHDLAAYVNGVGIAYIQMHYFPDEEEYLFFDPYLNLGTSTSDPIDVSIQAPPVDTWIGFTFYAHMQAAYPGNGGNIQWYIYELFVTAFGNSLELDRHTWGGIKTALWY